MTRPDRPPDPSGRGPFHEGELAVQERTGVREEMAASGGRMYLPEIPAPHAQFFAQLPFLVAGSIDPRGGVWASVLAGRPGFLRVPEPDLFEIAARPAPGDPLNESLRPGAPLGAVGIDFAARRRARVNGIVESVSGGLIRLRVQQSFGNCPKYIQARTWSELHREAAVARAAERNEPEPVRTGDLDARARELVARADTFFIASVAPGTGSTSADPSRGVDASHRGGPPGFVETAGPRRLEFPDYVGNFRFNTLGNLAADPRAGLLFIEFATGDALLMSGTVEILWDDPSIAKRPGAQRLQRFELREWVRVRSALRLAWSERVPSPHLPHP